MTKREAIKLKAQIERDSGTGPASIMLDTRGRRPAWVVMFDGRGYYSSEEWVAQED